MDGTISSMSDGRNVITLKFISHSPEQTQSLGIELGKHAGKGDVFLLSGDLGSGKTCLTQGIAWGLEVKEYAFSPSFVLMREYHGRLPLYHVDFYRLDTIQEIVDLALDEYLYGSGICVIEWSEKGIAVLPEDNLHITLEYKPECDSDRLITLQAYGDRYRELVESINVDLEIWNYQ
jgi:tRNA threonylcarbamoyladenosine biosynthesis protein TsaE